MYEIRTVTRRGNSLAVVIPPYFSPPQNPLVYLAAKFIAYSEVFPLSDDLVGFKGVIGKVKLRKLVYKNKVRLMYTIPVEAVGALRLKEGDRVLLLRYSIGGEPLIIVYPDPPLSKIMAPLVLNR